MKMEKYIEVMPDEDKTLSELRETKTDEELVQFCLGYLDGDIATGDELLIVKVMNLFKEKGCSVSYSLRLLDLIGKIIPMLCPMCF